MAKELKIKITAEGNEKLVKDSAQAQKEIIAETERNNRQILGITEKLSSQAYNTQRRMYEQLFAEKIKAGIQAEKNLQAQIIAENKKTVQAEKNLQAQIIAENKKTAEAKVKADNDLLRLQEKQLNAQNKKDNLLLERTKQREALSLFSQDPQAVKDAELIQRTQARILKQSSDEFSKNEKLKRQEAKQTTQQLLKDAELIRATEQRRLESIFRPIEDKPINTTGYQTQNQPYNPRSIEGLKQQRNYYQQLVNTLQVGTPAFENARRQVSQLNLEINKAGNVSQTTAFSFRSMFSTFAGAYGIQIATTYIKDFIAEANKLQSAQLGLESVAKFKGINPQTANESIKQLDLVKNGLLTVGDAAAALKNLLATGFTLEQSIELLKRFGDAAAFNRQSSLEFGYAIVSATEGLKNQNSILVDNAGVTKNLSVILKEAGYSEKDLQNIQSDTNVRLALYNGLLKETQAQLGDAEKLTNTFAGQQAKLDAQTTTLKQNIGIRFQEALTGYTKGVNDAGISTKILADVIFGAATATYGMLNLLTNTIWVQFPSLIHNIAAEMGLMGNVFELMLNPLGTVYDYLTQIISLQQTATEGINKTLPPTDSDLLGGVTQPPKTNNLGIANTADVIKKKTRGGSRGGTAKDDALENYLNGIKEEIELKKLLGDLDYTFLKTKEAELKTKLDATIKDKERLKILREINDVIREQTEVINDLIEKQKNQFSRLPLADKSIFSMGKEAGNTGQPQPSNAPGSNKASTPYDLIAILSESSQFVSSIQEAMNILKVGSHTFVSELVSGFSTALSLINAIVSAINTINAIRQGVGFLTSFIPGGGAISGAVRGTPAMGGLVGPNNMNGIYNSLSAQSQRSANVTNVYIKADADYMRFYRATMPNYEAFKNAKAL